MLDSKGKKVFMDAFLGQGRVCFSHARAKGVFVPKGGASHGRGSGMPEDLGRCSLPENVWQTPLDGRGPPPQGVQEKRPSKRAFFEGFLPFM